MGNGLALLALSRATTMLPGMLCGLVLGVTNASVFVTVRPLTVWVTPRLLIGRVMAWEGAMITVASLAGGLLASGLASTVLAHVHATLAGMSFGRLDSILLMAGLSTVGSGVFARLTLYRAVRAWRGETGGRLRFDKINLASATRGSCHVQKTQLMCTSGVTRSKREWHLLITCQAVMWYGFQHVD